MEATYWQAKARTDLHPKCMSVTELQTLKQLFDYREMSDEEKALVLKALDRPKEQ